MKPSVSSDSVIFDVNEEGATLRLNLDALKALVSAVDEKSRRNGVHFAPAIEPDQSLAKNLRLDSLLMSIKDAASVLGVSRQTIYNLLKTNAIRAIKLGGRTMIPTQALRDYAASLTPHALEPANERQVRSTPRPKAGPSGHQKLRFKAVMALTGLSQRELFNRRTAGTFPRGVALSQGVLGWDQADVDAWIADPENYRAESES